MLNTAVVTPIPRAKARTASVETKRDRTAERTANLISCTTRDMAPPNGLNPELARVDVRHGPVARQPHRARRQTQRSRVRRLRAAGPPRLAPPVPGASTRASWGLDGNSAAGVGRPRPNGRPRREASTAGSERQPYQLYGRRGITRG